MKNRKIGFIIGLLLSLTLTGCNIFGGDDNGSGGTGGGNSTSDYEYSEKDIRYYTSAGEQICQSKSGSTSRKYFKAYDGYCAVAIANIGNSYGPVLVGEDQAQVCYKTDKDSTIVQSAGSIILNEKTYYYSQAVNFVSGKLDGKTDYGNYFSTFTTLEDVARDVASKASFIPVDESLKKVYSYTQENDGTVTIQAGPYFSTLEKAIIPSEIDGKTVGAIASKGFKGFTNLKEVVISSGITKVNTRAFEGCSQLHRAYIPSSVTTCGEYLFSSCASDLYLFCGVASRPNGYSSYFSSGTKVLTYGTKNYGENDDYLYAELVDSTLVISLYKGASTNVTVPETIEGKTVSRIGSYSFDEKEHVQSITLPSTINQINNYAFRKCYLLSEMVLPYGVITVNTRAFEGCSRLHRVYIPSSVTTCGEYLFSGCAADLYLFCGVTSRPNGYSSYFNSGVKLTTYGVKNYAESDEWLYSELIDGTIAISLYKGTSVNVTVPETIEGKTVSRIGGYSFDGNETMQSISLPSTIKDIKNYAFRNCLMLKEIKLPYGVETVDTRAFQGCVRLTRAYIPSSVTTCGEYLFSGCAADLYLFCGVTSRPNGYSSYYSSGVKKVTYSSSGYIDYENNLYSIQLSSRKLTLVSYQKNAEGTVTMPQAGDVYYNGNEYTITSIGTAFKGDTLVYSVNMPYSLKTIPNNAFDGCTNLSFVFDFTQTDVTYIGDYAFRNTKLSEMHLPRSMEYIGEGAFYGTTFTTLYYAGSKEDWQSIGKSDGGLAEFILNVSWRKGSAITQVTCIGGTIYL